jgi:micrococcal nuclease
VLGKKVKFAFGGRHKDRYGRYLAQVFLEDGGGDEWVQGALLAVGHARVYGLPESFACSHELLAHEAEARRNHLGLWGNDVYRTKPANKPAALMTLRGKYQRVIGSVASIDTLNFGTDYRSDFCSAHREKRPRGQSRLGAHARGSDREDRDCLWLDRSAKRTTDRRRRSVAD